MPYAVCMEVRGMQCVIERAVERYLPHVVCVENGDCGAWYSHRAWYEASLFIYCVCIKWMVWCMIHP